MWQNNRSCQQEILDLGTYTLEEYRKCLELLNKINKWLGGFRASKRACKKLDPTSILDVGCGGGAYCLYLEQLFPKAKIVGIDINKDAVAYAKSKSQESRVLFYQKGALDYPDNSFDLVTTMLVCHHMTDEELLFFLQESRRVCSKAVLINDLHRHFFAYLSISFLIPFFFRNRLIAHDGPLSVRRSFRKKDWLNFLQKAGIKKNQVVLRWNWAFRWTVMVKK